MTKPKYNIIYADPPWKYDNERNNDPKQGGMTYPTMTMEELKALRVQDIAADDCALFMWGTWPKLPEALEVIKAWGFRYTTCAFVWVKLNPKGVGVYSGMGHWTNGNTEFVLFGKQGAPKRNEKNVKQVIIEPELIVAPRGRHSAKPAVTRERIVSLMGDRPRIELFAREKAEGWTAWGNEVESDVKL